MVNENTHQFKLRIECHNFGPYGSISEANSVPEALNLAHTLEDNRWPDSGVISDDVLRKCATLVREAVEHYRR